MADLKTQYRNLKPEIDAAISRVLESAAFILGPEVAALEEEFAAYSGASYGIGVNSGTSAIHLAVLAAGIGEGHEVITTPFTFVATAAAIRYAGARPVFVDIDPTSFNIDPAKLEAAITPATRAIMPVHLYGQSADMDPILEIARQAAELFSTPEKPRFVALKENGQLTSPAQAAQRLLDYLERPDFGSTPVDDVRKP